MQRFVLISITLLMVAPYLVSISLLPGAAKFLPEVVSLLAAMYVIAAGVGQRFRFVPVHYWFVFGLMAIWMVCGVLANSVGTGPIVAASRSYFRAIPFFFLATVFNFQDSHIRQQLNLLLILSFLQLPVSFFQRYTVYSERRFTGDPVFGTLMVSSTLSIFLISAVCILIGLLMRGRISKTMFAILFFILLIPTTINETRGTLLLMPLGVLVAFVVASSPRKRLRVAVVTISLIVAFGAIFIPVYDAMNAHSDRPSIMTYFTEEGRLEQELSKDAQVGTTEYKALGRGDALIVPIQYVSRDPVSFVFGLGMGNATESSLGPQFVGEYFTKFKRFIFTSTAIFLLELGVLGTAAVFLIHWFIFRDALAIARADHGIRSVLAIGFCGIVAVMALGSFYKRIHDEDALSYLYWYFAGLIASWRLRQELVSVATFARKERPVAPAGTSQHG